VTYFGGEATPMPQPAGFGGWTAMQASPMAPTQVQPGWPTMPAPVRPAPAGTWSPGAGAGMGLGAEPSVRSVTAEALRQQVAAALQRCYHWLEVAIPIVPQVSWLVPILVTAVQQYEAQQYQASLYQSWAVVQAMRQVQAAVPTLPQL
jgi:hypothetical protein